MERARCVLVFFSDCEAFIEPWNGLGWKVPLEVTYTLN